MRKKESRERGMEGGRQREWRGRGEETDRDRKRDCETETEKTETKTEAEKTETGTLTDKRCTERQIPPDLPILTQQQIQRPSGATAGKGSHFHGFVPPYLSRRQTSKIASHLICIRELSCNFPPLNQMSLKSDKMGKSKVTSRTMPTEQKTEEEEK